MGRRRLALALVPLLVGCGPSSTTEAAPRGPGEDGGGWTRLPDAPLTGRTGSVVASLGADRVLVVGGWAFLCPPGADCVTPEEPLLTDGALLDLSTGRWRPIVDAPYGVRDAQTALVGDDLYLLSGCRGGPSCYGPPGLLRYDVDADRWDEPADPPRGLRYAELVSLEGRLLALATTDEHGERADALYDPASDTWSELPDDPLPSVYDRFAVVDDDRLLVFGSPRDGTDEGPSPKVAAAYDLTGRRWTRLPDAPAGGWQALHIGDEVWLNPHFGPGGGGVLDLASDTWRDYPPLPHRDAYDLAGIVGTGEAVYEYSSGWLRDTRTDRWLQVPARPEAGYDESLAAVGEALFVFGGQRWEGSEEGELLADAWVWRPTT